MNKAFLKEPDDTGERDCPRCGARGLAVGRATLVHQLRPDLAATAPEVAFFCPAPSCLVAYFDLFERVFEIDALVRPVHPKDPDAPLCPCFGFTAEDVERDLDERGATRTRALVARAKSPEARCLENSPDGRSCVATVQRCYMRRQSERSRG
jgi:hypothetical protein